MVWISSTRKVNAPNAIPARTSPRRNLRTWESAWMKSTPIRAAKSLRKSAAIWGNSKCRLCATLPIAPPTCTTAASRLSGRSWIYTRREGCLTPTWTLASHPFIWMSKPSRICWLFSLHSTEKAGRKSPRLPPSLNRHHESAIGRPGRRYSNEQLSEVLPPEQPLEGGHRILKPLYHILAVLDPALPQPLSHVPLELRLLLRKIEQDESAQG